MAGCGKARGLDCKGPIAAPLHMVAFPPDVISDISKLPTLGSCSGAQIPTAQATKKSVGDLDMASRGAIGQWGGEDSDRGSGQRARGRNAGSGPRSKLASVIWACSLLPLPEPRLFLLPSTTTLSTLPPPRRRPQRPRSSPHRRPRRRHAVLSRPLRRPRRRLSRPHRLRPGVRISLTRLLSAEKASDHLLTSPNTNCSCTLWSGWTDNTYVGEPFTDDEDVESVHPQSIPVPYVPTGPLRRPSPAALNTVIDK